MSTDPRQVKLIALYSTRYSVRGGVGLVFLLVALIFGLSVAAITLKPVETLAKQVAEQRGEEENRERIIEEAVENLKPVIGWALGGGSAGEDADRETMQDVEAWTQHLFVDKPAPLSAILMILLFGWPFAVALGAFDMFSGDIGSRGLRFQLLRADRSSIYFGRLIGSTLTCSIILAVLTVTIVVYMGFKLPFYEWSSLIGLGLTGLVALIVVSLPYIAVCSWISAGLSSSFASLTLCSLLIGAVPLFALIGGAIHPAGYYVNYALPWGIQRFLLHYSMGTALLTVLACLGYTALFVWLGHRKLTTRDL